MTDAHPPPPNPEEDTEAHVARAGARGALLGQSSPDQDALEEAFAELENGSEEEWRSFGDAFVAAARAGRAKEWTAMLEAALSEASAHLEPDWRGDEGAVKAATKAWSEETDPSAVWGPRHRRDTGTTPLLSSLSRLLLGLDTSAALRALEQLPYPQPFADVLDRYAGRDPDRILRLIAAAAPAFDGEGHWLSGHPLAALVATDIIVVHATSLFQDVWIAAPALDGGAPGSEGERALRRLEEDDVPRWLKRAFQAVMQRGDGAFVALCYLAHLVRADRLGSGHRKAVALSVAALAEVLRESSVGVEQARGVWQAREDAAAPTRAVPGVGSPESSRRSSTEGEGSRTLTTDGLPALMGAVAVLGDAPSADDVAGVWDWFETLLLGRDPGLFLVRSSSGSPPGVLDERVARLAVLFAQLHRPGEAIRSAYARLQPQRRRLQFRRRYDDHDMELPSVLLLRVSLGVAVRMASDPAQTASAQELLLWAYRQARRLWLVQPLDVTHERAHLVAACFAAVPAVFSHDPAETLREMVPPIANDPVMLSNACWMLASTGGGERVLEWIEQAGGNAAEALNDARHLLSEYGDVGPMVNGPSGFPVETTAPASAVLPPT